MIGDHPFISEKNTPQTPSENAASYSITIINIIVCVSFLLITICSLCLVYLSVADIYYFFTSYPRLACVLVLATTFVVLGACLAIRKTVYRRKQIANAGVQNNQDNVLEEIYGVLKFMQIGWIFWYALYLLLGFLTIACPSIAALGMLDPSINQLLSAIGVLSAALAVFTNAHDFASKYDLATQLAWKAWAKRKLYRENEKEVSDLVCQAIDATTFKYERVSSTKS